MHLRLPRGITLLETAIYIGLFSMVLPAFVMFVFHIWQGQVAFDARTRLEQTSALVFLETTHALTEADSIRISTSTLGTDSSVLRFTDASGTEIIIDVASTSIDFGGTTHNIRRLRMQRGAATAVWLTDPELDVTQWRVDAVRNSTNTLTGMRINFDATLMNASGKVYRTATFAGDTTIALSPHTTEL